MVSDCGDFHEQCAEWAGKGECEVNPRYMLRLCRQACGDCQPDHGKWNILRGCRAGVLSGYKGVKLASFRTKNVHFFLHLMHHRRYERTIRYHGIPRIHSSTACMIVGSSLLFLGCQDKSSDCAARAAEGECYTASSWDAIFQECPKSCHQVLLCYMKSSPVCSYKRAQF